MTLEATRNRLANLATYNGEISIEGAIQNEIVVRIPFSDNETGTIAAEMAYNALLDIEDERCKECGSYSTSPLMWGLCAQCARKAAAAQ